MRTRSQRVSWSGLNNERTKYWGMALTLKDITQFQKTSSRPPEKSSYLSRVKENLLKDEEGRLGKEGRRGDSLPKEEAETSVHPVLCWMCAQRW